MSLMKSYRLSETTIDRIGAYMNNGNADQVLSLAMDCMDYMYRQLSEMAMADYENKYGEDFPYQSVPMHMLSKQLAKLEVLS